MDITTTGANKTFVNIITGGKFNLPSDFPSAQDRADIARIWLPLGPMDARGNFAHAMRLLTSGWIPAEYNIDEMDGMEIATARYEEWESMKDAFAQEYGHGWRDILGYNLEEEAPAHTSEATDADIRKILEYKNAKDFKFIPKDNWNSLLYGGYSSRRACVNPVVWMDRSIAAGWRKATVGMIAEIVWSCPITELDLH